MMQPPPKHDRLFLCIGPNVFGFGPTVAEARKEAKRHKRGGLSTGPWAEQVWICREGATFDNVITGEFGALSVEVSFGDRAAVAAGFDDPMWITNPLRDWPTMKDKRTNRYRVPVRVAREVLDLFENCPANSTEFGGEYAETAAVRSAIDRIRRAINEAA